MYPEEQSAKVKTKSHWLEGTDKTLFLLISFGRW